MKGFKKFFSTVLVLALLLSMGAAGDMDSVKAAATITDNYTKGTAYNLGKWSSISSATLAILPAGQNQSWMQFTVAANEHISLRVSSDREYAGMTVNIDGDGITRRNPDNLIDHTGVTPALYLNCDNTSTATRTYYLLISRGTFDSTKQMYFSISAENRIRTGQGTFSFSGSASNSGNTSLNLNGINSTAISLNLSNSTSIPIGAIVTNVRTTGTQSPSQGNVRHMIQPGSTGQWYTTTVTSATSGTYSVTLNDNLAARQVWNFSYNAMATAKSTMSSVKITLQWQYDMANTNYQIFTN